MSDDFPTVGLDFDFAALSRGQKQIDKLEQSFDALPQKARAAGEAISQSMRKASAASQAATSENNKRATSAERAAAAEIKAAARAAAEQQRFRAQLRSVQSAWDRAQASSSQQVAEKQISAARRSAAEQEKAARYIQQVKINSFQMEERERNRANAAAAAAARASAAEQERIQRYLTSVKVESFKMEERERNRIAQAQQAAARSAAADQERVEKYLRNVRLESMKMEERDRSKALTAQIAAEKAAAAATAAAHKAAAAQQEKDRKYLQQVRINSLRMEEQAAKAAAREEARRVAASARLAGARSGGGLASVVAGGDLSMVDRFMRALGNLRNALGDTRSLIFDVRTAIGVFLGGLVIKPIIDAADAMTALESRTRLYAARASDVPYIFEQVYQTAQNARAGLEGVAMLYTRLAPLSQQLGKSQAEILKTVETVSKAFAIGGASAQEATASAQQFAQALSSNRFGGDELRSVAENAPVLLQAIAEGVNKINPSLNLNAATFIKWAQAGNANSAIVVKALDASAAKIDAMFKQFPTTISQATTLVQNAFQRMVGEVNKATGASTAIANLLAKFSAFLESKRTIDAVTGALNAMGSAASATFGVLKLIGDYLPTIITMMVVLAGAAGIQAATRAMVTLQYAFMIAGREMTIWNVIAGVTTVTTRGLYAAIGGLTGILTGGVLIAIGAVVAAFNAMSNAQKTASRSAEMFASAQEGAIGALQRAATFTAAYGGSTDNLARSLSIVAGANDQAAGATKGASDQNSAALRIAQARAEAEKTLTVAILRRAAADAGKDAGDIDKSINGFFGLRNQVSAIKASSGWEKNTLLSGAAKRREGQISEAEKNLARLRQTQEQLTKAADELEKLKVTATVPEPIIAAGLGTTEKDLKGLDGAINRIAKMREEVDGLRAIFASLAAGNPLSALSEQINAAGEEAAAQYTSGKAAKAGFAEKARALGQDRERLKILVDLKRAHLDSANAASIEAANDKFQSDAARSAAETMRDFWGQGERSLEDYMRALSASREAQDDAAIAQANLSIAQRYNAQSLDDIAEALARNRVAYGDYAQSIEDAAKVEAAARAGQITARTRNQAGVSRPDDVAAYNARMAQEALDAFDKLQTRGQMLADSLTDAFGSVGQSIGDLLNVMNAYSERQLRIMSEIQAARDTFGADSEQARQAEIRGNQVLESARLKSYGDMTKAAKGFFDKGTNGYKALAAAEKAFRLIEFAMSAKSVVVKTAETAAKVGLFGTQAAAAAQAGAAEMFASLGPLGFAAVAAMLAVLAGLGFSGGGGGVSAPPISETRQAAQGSGSVLGDSAAKSESITRALEIANGLLNQGLSYSSEMVRSLRSIENSIGAVSSLIARSLGVGGAFSSDGLGLGSASSKGGLGGALAGGLLGGAAGYGIGAAATAATGALMSGFSGVATALAGPVGLAVGAVGALVGALTKTKVTTELIDQGLQFSAASLGDIMNGGLRGQSYQEIAVTKKKSILGIGLGSKTSASASYQGLGDDITNQLNLVVRGLQDGVLSAAAALGIKGAEEALRSFEVNLGKISFKDMTGDQIEEALSAVFGKLGDDMAKYVLPAISEFQKVGEGAFETIVRLAAEYQAVDAVLGSIGMSFKTVGVESIAARNYLIQMAGGIDEFSSQAKFFADNFLTDAERQKSAQERLSAAMAQIGYSSISTKDQFKNLVQGLDLSTKAGADLYNSLMVIAPLFAQVAEVSEKKSAEILSKRQEIQDKIDKITMSDADYIAKKRQEEKNALAELSPDLALLVQQFYDLSDAAEKNSQILSKRQEIQDKIDKLSLSESEYKAKQRAAELEAVAKLDPSLASLLQRFYDLSDAADEAAAQIELANERQNLMARLYRALGNDGMAKMIERQMELARVTDSVQRALLLQVYAAEDAAEALSSAQSAFDQASDNLRQAYEDQKSSLESTRDKFAQFSKTLLDFRDSLDTGEFSISTLQQQYDVASGTFDQTAALARLGNEDALGSLVSVSENFLKASRAQARTQLEYALDLAAVKDATGASAGTADRQADIAQKQLDALNAQVSALISLNETSLTMSDAITAFLAAQQQLIAAKAAVANVAQGGGVRSPANDNTSTGVYPVSGAGSTGSAAFDWILANSMAGKANAGDPMFSGVYQNAKNYTPGYNDLYAVYGVDYANAALAAGVTRFANGGVFDQGEIVRSAANFNIGQMGEDGPETIMPLVQTSAGLGVRAVASDGGSAQVSDAVSKMADDNRRFQIAVLKLLGDADTREQRRDTVGQLVRGAPEPLSAVNVKVV